MLAAAILAGIQGGVVMLTSTGDDTPLEAALDLGIGYLQANPARPARIAEFSGNLFTAG